MLGRYGLGAIPTPPADVKAALVKKLAGKELNITEGMLVDDWLFDNKLTLAQYIAGSTGNIPPADPVTDVNVPPPPPAKGKASPMLIGAMVAISIGVVGMLAMIMKGR